MTCTQTIIEGFDPSGPFAGLLLPPRFLKRQSETRFKQRWKLTAAQYMAMMREFKGPRKQRGIICATAIYASGDKVVLENHTDNDLVFSGTAIAGFEFTNGGSLLLIDDADPSGEWWSAGFTSGIGDDYEVRALSGGTGGWTNAAAADNVWITMTTTRRWDVQRSTIGTESASDTFEVGLDGVESALDSAVLSANATRDI